MMSRKFRSRWSKVFVSTLIVIALLASATARAQSASEAALRLQAGASQRGDAEGVVLLLGLLDLAGRSGGSSPKARSTDNDRSPAQEPIAYASSADGAGYCAEENGHGVYYAGAAE